MKESLVSEIRRYELFKVKSSGKFPALSSALFPATMIIGLLLPALWAAEAWQDTLKRISFLYLPETPDQSGNRIPVLSRIPYEMPYED